MHAPRSFPNRFPSHVLCPRSEIFGRCAAKSYRVVLQYFKLFFLKSIMAYFFSQSVILAYFFFFSDPTPPPRGGPVGTVQSRKCTYTRKKSQGYTPYPRKFGACGALSPIFGLFRPSALRAHHILAAYGGQSFQIPSTRRRESLLSGVT